jgi:hypothetical protein
MTAYKTQFFVIQNILLTINFHLRSTITNDNYTQWPQAMSDFSLSQPNKLANFATMEIGH